MLYMQIKENFKDSYFEVITHMYIETRYLLESSELVRYEHYFSDQFKMGMFLPITIPFIYAVGKAFRGIKLK